MKKIILTIILLIACAPLAHAQQNGFASSSEEILKMLTDDGGRVYLKIEFDVNSARINKKAVSVVDALGNALTTGQAADMEVKLIGHTDSAGNSEYNRRLSLKRAQAVKEYLTGNFRLDSSRISVEGQGEDKPIASNDTAAGRALNRRVEVINTGRRPDKKSLMPDAGKVLFQ